MAKITKTVHIKAEPDKVIEYIADVDHHPAFISALKSIDELSEDSRHHTTEWRWSFIMAGVELQGRATTVDYQPGRRYSFKTLDGADSTFVYTAEAEDDGTLLTIDVEYELPHGVLAKVADQGVIKNFNETEADRASENLKAILEN